MTANWEKRSLHSFGSNFRIDVCNPQTTTAGSQIYEIYGVTDKEEDVNLVGLGENGNFHIYNDRTIEIVGGQKATSSGVDILIQGKNGDVCINADRNGRVRIRAKDITLQADEDIDIVAGRNVSIKSGSGRTLIAGNVLEKSGLKGNLLDDAAQWATRVFEDTGLPAGAFGALLSPFSGLTDLAGGLISSPSLFSGLVDGAIGGALTGITGGIGGIASGALGSLTGGLGDLAGGALGSLTGGLGDLAGGLVGDTLGGVVDGALGGITGGLGGIADGAIGGLTGGLNDVVGGLTDGLTSTVSSLSGGLTETVGDFMGFDLNQTVGGLANTATNTLLNDLTSGLTDNIGNSINFEEE
tara:strand:+ start:17026 stop:18090 length:1065 start_codon:yes stop_codon:yes gene_type:complete